MGIRNLLAAGSACVLFLSGCSSVGQVQYGKLYTMQEMLSKADNNCGDSEARDRAISWAVHGIQDLNDSRIYMDPNSEDYRQTRYLVSNLALITSRRNLDEVMLCRQIAQARQATDQFLNNKSNENVASVEKE